MGNSSQYVKLSDTELYVRITIEKEDGTPFNITNDNGSFFQLQKEKQEHLLISFFTVCGLV